MQHLFVENHSSFTPAILFDLNEFNIFFSDEFDQYCTKLESTLEWGGHLEVRYPIKIVNHNLLSMTEPTSLITLCFV